MIQWRALNAVQPTAADIVASEIGMSRVKLRSPSRRRRLVGLLRVLALLAAIAVAVLIGRRIDLYALGTILRTANRSWLVLATIFVIARLASKAAIWRASLSRTSPVPFGQLVRYTMAAIAASVVTPARAGETLRLWLLRREHGVPLSQSAGAALGEKILDGLALLMLVLPLPWLVPGLPAWVEHTIGVLAALSVPGLVIGWWFARRRAGAGRIAMFLGQIRILREPRTLAWAFLACLAGWLFDLSALWASMRAVGVVEKFGAVTFVLLVINAALIIPSTPGNFGALEAGAVLGLDLLHVERAPAVAVALLYHGAQLVPLLIFALFNPRLMLGGTSITCPPVAATVPTEGL